MKIENMKCLFVSMGIMVFFLSASVGYSEDAVFTAEDVIKKEDIIFDKKLDTPLNGYIKLYYESGKLEMEGQIKNGRQEGLGKAYYQSGELKTEAIYKNGKMNGVGKTFHDSGKLKAECTYKDGKEEGLGKEYYESGKLKTEAIFKKGKKDGLFKIFSESGKLKMEGQAKDGKIEGFAKEYFDSGMLKMEGQFKDGELEGLAKAYSESGKLIYEGQYKNGKQLGAGKESNESSRTTSTSNVTGEMNTLVKEGDWNSKWKVDVNKQSLTKFIDSLNKKMGTSIKVVNGENKLISLKGELTVKQIFEKVLQLTDSQLLKTKEGYVVESKSNKFGETNKEMICDVLLQEGTSYLEVLTKQNADKSITIKKNGLVISFDFDKIRSVKNCETVKEVDNEEADKVADNSGYSGSTNSGSNSNTRPIGTVIVPLHGDTEICYQIVVTNDIVSGFHGYRAIDTGNIIGIENIPTGTFDTTTGYIKVEYYSYEYPTLKVNLRTLGNSFKISGNNVIDKDGKTSGKFYPNSLMLKSDITIPNTQGCRKYWGDPRKMVYYWSGSELFDKIHGVWNSNYIYFCSEQDALNQGYKKSLR